MNTEELNFTGASPPTTLTDGPPSTEFPQYLVLNVTRDLPVEYLVVMFGYLTPLFFLITVVANIMIVLVLSRPTMLTPTNLVLLAMAVADLLTLIFPVPWYFYIYTLGHYRHFLEPALVCTMYNINTEILPAFFHTASIWLTLLLAAQRYVYICHPSLAKIWCTNGRVAKVIAFTFLAALLHQLPRFFERNFENVIIPPASSNSSEYDGGATELVTDIVGTTAALVDDFGRDPVIEGSPACMLVMADWVNTMEDFYFSAYFIFRIIFVHIGPCLVLVILNFLLYSALKRAERTRARLFLKPGLNTNASIMGSDSSPSDSIWKRKQSLCPPMYDTEISTADAYGRRFSCKPPGSRSGGTGSGRDANSTTFMLIVVVTVFLIVEMPLAVTTAVHIIENLLEMELVSDRALNMTILFSNFFIIITYPLNFAIYCGMSRAFRLTFQQLFVRRWNISMASTTTTTINVIKQQHKSSQQSIVVAVHTGSNSNINNSSNTDDTGSPARAKLLCANPSPGCDPLNKSSTTNNSNNGCQSVMSNNGISVNNGNDSNIANIKHRPNGSVNTTTTNSSTVNTNNVANTTNSINIIVNNANGASIGSSNGDLHKDQPLPPPQTNNRTTTIIEPAEVIISNAHTPTVEIAKQFHLESMV